MDRQIALDSYMAKNRKCFPEDKLDFVRDSFAGMNETSFQVAVNHKLKSPGAAFAFALLMPGVDRIYLGSVGKGILQIMLLNGLTCGILPLIHLFSVWGETREYNLKEITEVIRTSL